MLNRSFANWSARPSSASANRMLSPDVPEMWQLKSSRPPSCVDRARRLAASVDGSPSVDSPSVMLITMGGKLYACAVTHGCSVLCASLSASHIGVAPAALASNHTGNLTLISAIPPAPSSSFFMRSSTRAGWFATALMLASVCPESSPTSAGSTSLP